MAIWCPRAYTEGCSRQSRVYRSTAFPPQNDNKVPAYNDAGAQLETQFEKDLDCMCRNGAIQDDCGRVDPGGNTGEKWRVSPGRTCVFSSVPAASSRTERARRQPDRRHGGTLLLTFLTTFRRSRKTRSIANFMPKVCTASHGTIHRPSPSPSPHLPSRPRVRAGPRSATSTQARVPCVLRLRTSRRMLGSLRCVTRSRIKRAFRSQEEIFILIER